MRKLSTLFILSFLFLQANAQKKNLLERIKEKVLSSKPDTSRSPGLMPLPVFGLAQETGFEIGAGLIYSFYQDRADSLNRASTIYGHASYATKGQIYASIKADLWSKGNKMHYFGQNSFTKIPIYFYGVGNHTLEANRDLIVQNQLKFTWDIERLLAKQYYGGINVGFENYTFKDKEPGGIFENDRSLVGTNGGQVLYLGIIQAFDNRNSNTYTTKGNYLKGTYSYAPDLFGGNNFHGSIVKLDLRSFYTVTPKLTAAVNVIYNGISGKHATVYLMPQMGNDAMMRGYYMGRFRDNNLLAGQLEMRYRFHPRFGVVAFGGTGKVFHSKLDLDEFKPNFGGGIRYFFDPGKGLSLRLDYGLGEKRAGEKRQSGIYIGFGEAF